MRDFRPKTRNLLRLLNMSLLTKGNFYPKGAKNPCNISLLNPLINMSNSVSQTVELVYTNVNTTTFRHHLSSNRDDRFRLLGFFLIYR